MTKRRAVVLVIAMSAGLACHTEGVIEADAPRVGDYDPNAPPGWPLAIGDPETVSWWAPGGVREDFDYWEGNCCINWVDGVPYTAKWRDGWKDGVNWQFYEGHVPAEPRMTWKTRKRTPEVALSLTIGDLMRFDSSLAAFRESDPETYQTQDFQEFVAQYRSERLARIERYRRGEIER